MYSGITHQLLVNQSHTIRTHTRTHYTLVLFDAGYLPEDLVSGVGTTTAAASDPTAREDAVAASRLFWVLVRSSSAKHRNKLVSRVHMHAPCVSA